MDELDSVCEFVRKEIKRALDIHGTVKVSGTYVISGDSPIQVMFDEETKEMLIAMAVFSRLYPYPVFNQPYYGEIEEQFLCDINN